MPSYAGFCFKFPFNLVPECSGFREYPWWVLARKPNISIWNWIQTISRVGSRKQSLFFPSGFDITWHCLLSLLDLSPISPHLYPPRPRQSSPAPHAPPEPRGEGKSLEIKGLDGSTIELQVGDDATVEDAWTSKRPKIKGCFGHWPTFWPIDL